MGCSPSAINIPMARNELESFDTAISLKDLEILLTSKINKGAGDACNDTSVNRTENDGKTSNDRLRVYGRIFTTKDAETLPVKLSDVPDRKTAFLFGPETVYGTLLHNIHNPYEMLIRLGFLPEYIHLKACKLKSCYWLTLVAPSNTESIQTCSEPSQQGNSHIGRVTEPCPATWDGLKSFLEACYPEALPAIEAHWPLITTKPVEYFEKKSPVKFIDALRDPHDPTFMSYARFCALPAPQEDWETRLFLYCELRILELFSGDGHTWSEAGVKGEKEFLAPNYCFEEDLRKDSYFFIKLQVDVPPEVKEEFGDGA